MALRVDFDGLRVIADGWATLAGDVGIPAPSGIGHCCQASAAAVNAGNAGIAAAATALIARVQAGADKVATANSGYASNEVSSASLLAPGRMVDV